MSTKGTTYWEDEPETPMQWVGESRQCPFDDLPARICGCPEGERIMDAEAHLIRGED